MSVRQQIVDAIETRLKLIAAGHQFALNDGAHTCATTIKDVYLWRKTGFAAAQVPAIAFYDLPDDMAPATNVHQDHNLQVKIEAYLAPGSDIDAARAVTADILAAIASDTRWGTLARFTRIDEATIDQQQAGDVVCGAQITITVQYRTTYGRM